MTERDYCGCCGREITDGQSTAWCADCLGHVLHEGHLGRKWWDSTYLAQHGVDCPFQLPLPRASRAAAATTKGSGRGDRKRAPETGTNPEPAP